MNRKQVIALLVITPVLMLLIGQACSDTALLRGMFNQSSVGGIDFCTTPAQSMISNLKYIFVFDHSGSNQQNFVQNPNPPGNFIPDNGGSDQDGSKRYPPLVNFLQNIPDNQYTYYSVINFSDQATIGLNWMTAGARTTAVQAVNYLNAEQTRVPGPPPHPADGGGTNYNATLDQIVNMISTDVANAKAAVAAGSPLISSDYVIFWVSDGAPYFSGALQTLPTILGKVTSVLAIRNSDPDYVNSITLNTGFYHLYHDPASANNVDVWGILQDQQAASYMSAMATNGQGVFMDFQSAVIDYTRFSVPLRTAKFQLKDVWVQNSNSVWWNGQIMQDSDADGLPDNIEQTVGSSVSVSDSDNNGAGDGVEYFLFGRPCQSPTCSAAGAASYQQQCGPIPASGVYRDVDQDFLNDCEERLLGSRFDDFDSNLDYVPDQFEWISRVAFLRGVNDLLSDPDGDNVTNYFELKTNLPVQYANSQLAGVTALKYTTSIMSDNASQTCYRMNVDKLVTFSQRDVIRVFLMEARGAVGTLRKMRVAQKQMTGNRLILTNGDFTP